ncbi:Protein kinase domain-containing protein [Fusarium keratoplasticum]|uniref:Protein kinase domain-containing protein n=1 Tax=Fusarium keratoplasticum TaxID=1328300 RepID=A0ACC0RED0_9HYPO|nr:Protein kinase domain-containing protein [Fusarium keratoplasticum]KAI8684471.1 Protein kinase domain-containing protein [Fusarium keratoplasticum]KAI8688583.1 Protein kinase domain-containing protein [Fusarium keratoplasticum]
MASLQVRGPDFSVTKQKAIEDAKKMQKLVTEQCSKTGKDPPEYRLSELIGKGSFGRVYKATSLTTNQLVAVKIIDIEESDTAIPNPKFADTYSDLLKEISALKLLSDTGAKNINHVIEALPVGQSMWMITEYCAGGSVATLMKPTSPGGLQEKWIIPILREVAEAVHWVHKEGIIHRDIKCANILVTEVGDVQLCDFGVAGVIETKFDKRSTVIGTPHWMAPELFDPAASYGTEVDIWAFGAMVYEIASGLPPNVAAGMDFNRLGSYLKQHIPRLEGDRYSPGLKDLVAYCLEDDPKKRPTIEEVQHHRYLHNTQEMFPTSTLAQLVKGYKLWEAKGGNRKSLFSAGGAQGPSDFAPTGYENDEWNFSTTAAFDQQVLKMDNDQAVYDVYGSSIDLRQDGYDDASRTQKPKSRRRPPPHLPSVKAPLEKLFDPNTISNYEDNSRAYYGRFPPPSLDYPPPPPPPASDLPLRDDSSQSQGVRESLIDLDASLDGSNLSEFVDMNTIRAGDPRASTDYDFGDVSYNKPPLSDPELNNNRRTQDWKFPSMAPPASANPEMFRFPFNDDQGPSTSRLIHPPTEPIQPSSQFNDLAVPSPINNRASSGSLIDLDMSLADPINDYPRPSTSHSDVGSIAGSEMGGANPFELEKHASLYVMPNTIREPSIYVSDDSEYANAIADLSLNDTQRHDPQPSFQQPQPLFQAQQPPPQGPSQPPQTNGSERPYSLSEFVDTDPESFTPQPTTIAEIPRQPSPLQEPPPSFQDDYTRSFQQRPFLPPAPTAPSPQVMEGQASSEQVKEELRRMAMSLSDHLNQANTYLSGLPIRRASTTRVESIGDTP